MSCCHAYHGGERRYSHHENPAIRLISSILETFQPKRASEYSAGEDILICAMLYLEGDLLPGHSVERYFSAHPNRTALALPESANQKEGL